MDPVQEPAITPMEPTLPAVQDFPASIITPNGPEESQQTPNSEMDTSADNAQPLQPAAIAEAAPTEDAPPLEPASETSGQTDVPVAEVSEETTPTSTEETTQVPAQESAEQSAPAAPEEEPATWAGLEEDTSSPDAEELKKIESSDGDYSAMECTSYSA